MIVWWEHWAYIKIAYHLPFKFDRFLNRRSRKSRFFGHASERQSKRAVILSAAKDLLLNMGQQ